VEKSPVTEHVLVDVSRWYTHLSYQGKRTVSLGTHCTAVYDVVRSHLLSHWAGRQGLFRVYLETSSRFTRYNGCTTTLGLKNISGHGVFKEAWIIFLLTR